MSSEQLCSYDSLLEENKQKVRRKKLQEKQFLYEAICQKTGEQQKKLLELAGKLKETEERKEAERILFKMTIIGAYVKRRSNLILMSQKSETVSVLEAELWIKESMMYLKQFGVTAAVRFCFEEKIRTELAGVLYDFLRQWQSMRLIRCPFFYAAIVIVGALLTEVPTYKNENKEGYLLYYLLNEKDVLLKILIENEFSEGNKIFVPLAQIIHKDVCIKNEKISAVEQ